MSKIQNEDVKSASELIGLGGTTAQLINTTKIYCPKSSEVLDDKLPSTTGQLCTLADAKAQAIKYAIIFS
jgi:hypothetical protein